jgi:hypothetical protein
MARMNGGQAVAETLRSCACPMFSDFSVRLPWKSMARRLTAEILPISASVMNVRACTWQMPLDASPGNRGSCLPARRAPGQQTWSPAPRTPVVAITGLAAADHIGRDTFQEIDQASLFSAITNVYRY